jgi:hypothetical protein
MSAAVLIAVFVMPWLWGAAVTGMDRMAPEARPDDRTEKRYLMILLAPVGLGVVAVLCARWLPMTVIQSDDMSAGHGANLWQTFVAWMVPACLAIYAAGVVIKAVPLARQFMTLHGIVRRAQPSTFAKDVRLTDAELPPLSWGRGVVLLPQGLVAKVPPAQTELLIAHERAHIRRGDIAWYAILSWIDALLWFNPFIRRQTARCRLAAELACDGAVTRMAPEDRETYAACLLAALKHASGAPFCAPAVLSATNAAEARLRMTEILTSASSRRPRPWAPFSAILLILPLLAMQYALAQPHAGHGTSADNPAAMARLDH